MGKKPEDEWPAEDALKSGGISQDSTARSGGTPASDSDIGADNSRLSGSLDAQIAEESAQKRQN